MKALVKQDRSPGLRLNTDADAHAASEMMC